MGKWNIFGWIGGWQALLASLTLAVSTGCVHTRGARDSHDVSARVADRMGLDVATAPIDGSGIMPADLPLSEGLTEDDAALIALWNNAAFQELLTDLGIARGDLIQAGLLPNPELVWLFQMPSKPLRYAVDFPLEVLWLRPLRIAAAQRESERVAERLTQAALDLIRDVRQAHADAILARGRLAIAEDGVKVRGEIAAAAEKRLQTGDISGQEAATARIDGLQAKQEVIRVRQDVALAAARLRNLLGLRHDEPIVLKARPTRTQPLDDAEALAADALTQRPDVVAADRNIEAAAERARLARRNWIRVLGIADATSGQRTGHELGPGVRFTVPIFNVNQGNIAKADAELEKAIRAKQTIADLVVLDVRQAHARLAQSRAEMEHLEQKVRPEVDAAIRRAESAYREGNAPYVIVLETTRQYLDTRLREETLKSEMRRALADLERSVGRRLEAPMPEESKR